MVVVAVAAAVTMAVVAMTAMPVRIATVPTTARERVFGDRQIVLLIRGAAEPNQSKRSE
jgi:hypothetical protein